MIIARINQSKVTAAERLTNTPEKLALSLLLLLFSQDELSKWNCSKPMRSDIKQLDAERLWAIKCNYTNSVHVEHYKPFLPDFRSH